LGIVAETTEQGWQAIAPSFRFDIALEEDLIEEIARVYGYNNIPNVAPKGGLVMREHKEAELSLATIKDLLVAKEYQEAITYSFVDPKTQALLHPEEEALVLPHPISVEMSAMRLSLWSGLLQAVKYNQNRQQSRVRIFETGLRFIPSDSGLPTQEAMIAGAITGNKLEEHWAETKAGVDFFDLKGDAESIIALTNDAGSFSFVAEAHTALHPGQSARIYRDGIAIGWCGALHPQLADKLGLDSTTYLFELSLSGLLQRKVPEAQAVSKFPANRRDIAIVVSETVNAGDIINAIRKVGGNQLVGIDLFDVYRGKGIPEGHKSLALALRLQDLERTLEEHEMATIVQRVVDILSSEHGACLRD
jgi:phenylalanyl-tRNA synthetase beta chain